MPHSIIEGIVILERFTVSVNYEMSINGFVSQGNYNFFDKDISDKNFPSRHGEGKREIDVTLFRDLNQGVELEERLNHLNMRFATLKEHLAFAIAYPNILRPENTIIVVHLGSSWVCNDGSPVVSCFIGSRRLGLELSMIYTDDRPWSRDCCFMAVTI